MVDIDIRRRSAESDLDETRPLSRLDPLQGTLALNYFESYRHTSAIDVHHSNSFEERAEMSNH